MCDIRVAKEDKAAQRHSIACKKPVVRAGSRSGEQKGGTAGAEATRRRTPRSVIREELPKLFTGTSDNSNLLGSTLILPSFISTSSFLCPLPAERASLEMSKRRRSSEFALHGQPPDLHILVDGSAEPLTAHLSVLSLFSKCVAELPKSSAGEPTIWDLRGLILEGEAAPVAAGVVGQWLDLVYSRVDAARRARPHGCLQAARPLLLFADAVDTGSLVLADLDRLLAGEGARVEVRVGEQLAVELELRGCLYYTLDATLMMAPMQDRSDRRFTVVVPAAQFEGLKASFRAAVCSELEAWLHLAGRLQLVQLARLLLDFLKVQLFAPDRSICQGIGSAFSPRVLECMPRELLLEGFVRDSIFNQAAGVQLSAEHVEARILTGQAGVWWGAGVGQVMEMAARNLAANDRTVLEQKSNGGQACVRHPMRAVVGGLSAQECAEVVQEVMSRVADGVA
ncbi:hypothetical protein TSOC_009101 [Tetrabaena socialis]|uniref:BTB domain-containing protein n=1 Tax=Tetrabaena socialis TaxID=47790 RepID=A0A2J7ZWS8_9CHLO|nr:hypothetical protein TSOC_009101 [Tetrabaena socialis]|eukprot:PNH04695.1 hypothetical protein TSOC_009101 [Tetrabaena socialis]